MPRVAVILSGCGVFDGSEIHEAVCTMLALSQAQVDYQCAAPDSPQMHVVDHVKGKPVPGEARNILVESARIARGKILPLASVRGADYDAFFFPGGFGAAKNLCTFAVTGADCTILPDVARVINEAYAAKKPMCFICIAPVVAARALGGEAHVKLTIGDDATTANAINQLGGKHVNCAAREALVDTEHRIVSTPAYMKANSLDELFTGINRAVAETLKLI